MFKSNVMEVSDLNAEELRPYLCRSEVQLLRYYEPAPGIFLAESPRVIVRALDAGYRPVSLLVEKSLLGGQAAEVIARCGDVPVYVAERETLLQITGFGMTQGVLCVMRRRVLPPVEEVCRGASRIAVLEDVVNPTNVGAIFRCAAALNFDAVLLTPACCDPLYRRSARVSMGTVFQIPWTYIDAEKPDHSGKQKTRQTGRIVRNPAEEPDYVGQLKRMGFAAAAMALREDSAAVDDLRLSAEERLAVILGTEGEGLRDSTISACDYTVMIPMTHGVDSLNVAAAAAIAFWQLGVVRRPERKWEHVSL